MLNKILAFIRRYQMIQPGDKVVCAVSGGADSMALLYAFYLLADKLQVSLSAAHFNHHLRMEESDRDESFVRDFCQKWEISFYSGHGNVVAGKKGLEAAAREARYTFLQSLPGKIATAHTADDNAETVLMHMVRGTGLKGLGGISPVRNSLIRPMLCITRDDVMAFLEEYSIPFVQDSSNKTDAFLRNRLRHHVMPLLKQENPRLAGNLSAMALGLREDEKLLAEFTRLEEKALSVLQLRDMPQAQRSRLLASYLERSGVREPEKEHIALAESLVFSEKPSAKASFPNGVTLCRNYDRLESFGNKEALKTTVISCPGVTMIQELGMQIICEPASVSCDNRPDSFVVSPRGEMVLRHRMTGDEIRLSGGTKSLKKLFIDKKIPAQDRLRIPVIADDIGVLGIYGIGANLDRQGKQLFRITFKDM